MDDPFGCLQGVTISSKMMQEILQKRNELHLCLLSNRINRCPSCKEQLAYVVNEFCRECPKCCRVFERDDDEQLQEENRGRSSTAPPKSNFHLKNIFRKWNIDKMFSSSEVAFLGKVIAQFQEITGKSVNYACFLHNYFEMVPSECWPHKKEIMESISHHLPKTFASRRRAKQEFEKWWSTTSSPTPTFVSN